MILRRKEKGGKFLTSLPLLSEAATVWREESSTARLNFRSHPRDRTRFKIPAYSLLRSR